MKMALLGLHRNSLARVESLYLRGLSHHQVAREVSLHHDTVYRILKQLGIIRPGFSIVELTATEKGIASMRVEFFPCY
jgi:hypothetical protein